MPYAKAIYPDGWILKKDGATRHTSIETQMLSEFDIQTLPWQPMFPEPYEEFVDHSQKLGGREL